MSKRRKGPSRPRIDHALEAVREDPVARAHRLEPVPNLEAAGRRFARARSLLEKEPELVELVEEMTAALRVATEVDRVPCGTGDVVRIARAYLHARGRPPGTRIRFVAVDDPEVGLVE